MPIGHRADPSQSPPLAPWQRGADRAQVGWDFARLAPALTVALARALALPKRLGDAIAGLMSSA